MLKENVIKQRSSERRYLNIGGSEYEGKLYLGRLALITVTQSLAYY